MTVAAEEALTVWDDVYLVLVAYSVPWPALCQLEIPTLKITAGLQTYDTVPYLGCFQPPAGPAGVNCVGTLCR